MYPSAPSLLAEGHSNVLTRVRAGAVLAASVNHAGAAAVGSQLTTNWLYRFCCSTYGSR
jgi:hypothetical protein